MKRQCRDMARNVRSEGEPEGLQSSLQRKEMMKEESHGVARI